MKKVFVVTINYNTESDTSAFLESIHNVNHDGFTVEILVVDNGSTKPFQLEKEYTNVTVIRSEENTGFSGGNNIGITKALELSADYILIINNDTIVTKNLLSELLIPFEGDEKIGVTTPKIYFAKGHEFHKNSYSKKDIGKVFWYAGGSTDWANVKSVHRGVDEVDNGQYDTPADVTFVTGCCMMIKREVFEKIGLFDENYFLYYEDADLNERISQAGFTLRYVPTALLMHVNAASSGGAGNPLQDYFISRNQMLFGMKYAPIRSKIALLRQSMRILRSGREMQKRAIKDFYARRFGKGSFFNN